MTCPEPVWSGVRARALPSLSPVTWLACPTKTLRVDTPLLHRLSPASQEVCVGCQTNSFPNFILVPNIPREDANTLIPKHATTIQFDIGFT